MVFQEIAVPGPGQAKNHSQIFGPFLVRNKSRAQGETIRRKRHLSFQNGIGKGNPHLGAIGLHHGFFLFLVAEKKHPPLAGLPVVILLKTIGPHVPIEHVDLSTGIQIQQSQSILDGRLATNTRAIGILRAP